MKLNEDFSELKQRIMINIKSRNLYFKTIFECEKLLDDDLSTLQEKEFFVTEDLFKSELKKLNSYIEDCAEVSLRSKLCEFAFYFLLITLAGTVVNLLKTFLALGFELVVVNAVVVYLTAFAAVIATPVIIYRKEKRFDDKNFKRILIFISAVGIFLFSYFSITSGPIKKDLFHLHIFVYILIVLVLSAVTIFFRKLSTK